MIGWACLWLLILTALAGSAAAHEARPAYLQVRETAPDRFDILWKQPAKGGMRLSIDAVLPEVCGKLGDEEFEATIDAVIRRWSVDCGGRGLRGRRISVDGLERTMIDVFVDVRFADDTSLSQVLRPESPSFVVAASRSGVASYFLLGVDHLLRGFDHILFVIGLTLLVPARWALVKTCTAFTLAHSITLALSALGVVHLSQRPVEAVIALSILFLAVELARGPGSRPTLTARHPWAIAFGFGLLHGFGFAGGLSDLGMPPDAVAAALLLFNVGLELGQLLVIAVVLTLLFALRMAGVATGGRAANVPVYGMGIISAYWFLERLWQLI